MADDVLVCEQVSKTYEDAGLCVPVLSQVSLGLAPAQSVAIMGPSGSGKSTLLHVLGGLDQPTSGRILWKGQDIAQRSEAQRCQMRRTFLGFLYQFHHLLPDFSLIENVMMPLWLSGIKTSEASARASDLLNRLGLSDRMYHYPGECSGGERQRAALARALVAHPACVLADEPTGNLDRSHAHQVFDALLELQRDREVALIVVTHDEGLASRLDRVVHLSDLQSAGGLPHE